MEKDYGVTPLTDAQREALVEQVEKEGYAIFPEKLPKQFLEALLEVFEKMAKEDREANSKTITQSVKIQGLAEQHEVFKDLVMYEPALQLCYDMLGPCFHLCQSNMIARPKENHPPKYNFLDGAPWHADGPRPNMFPKINGVSGMHYLKFGYFFSDLTHGNGGSLQVVRGSHLRPELDGASHGEFRIDNYKKDVVQFDVEAGTVVVFHQAQWHAAPPNESEFERKNVYVSYCPTWMKPLDRDYPTAESLKGYSPEKSWIFSEPRPNLSWWIPPASYLTRLDKYRRQSEKNKDKKDNGTVKYD